MFLKHVEHLTEINKLWNIASCWLYSANRVDRLLKEHLIFHAVLNFLHNGIHIYGCFCLSVCLNRTVNSCLQVPSDNTEGSSGQHTRLHCLTEELTYE